MSKGIVILGGKNIEVDDMENFIGWARYSGRARARLWEEAMTDRKEEYNDTHKQNRVQTTTRVQSE